MPCKVDISPDEQSNHFQVLLCQACKYLSPEQVASLINPGSGMHDGLDWYTGHLMGDYMQRCSNTDVLDFDYETTEHEKIIILKELNRVGYHLYKIEKGVFGLIELGENKDER